MRHPKGFLPIVVVLVAVVAALIVAGASYWYTKDKDEVVVNTNTAVITNTNLVVNENANVAVNSNVNATTNVNTAVNGNTNTAADPTAGWKTYTDKEHSYSVKYPSTWTQGGKCAEGDCYGARFADPKDQNIFVEIDYPQQGSDAKRYRDRDWLENVTTYGDQILSTSEEPISAFSVYAKTVKFNRIARTDTMAWFYNNEKIYFFYFSDGERLVRIAGGNIDILRLMTSTFIFLDETAGWKTYTNAELGYSFMYPKEYTVSEVAGTVVAKDANNTSVFDVRYKLEATDGSLTTWFDTSPTSDATLGGRTGKKFIFQYCDGPGCGKETVAYVVKHETKLLGLEFLGDKEMSALENTILSTFTFTK